MQENKKDKHEELPIEEFENDSQDIREEFLSKFNKKEEKPEETKDDKVEKSLLDELQDYKIKQLIAIADSSDINKAMAARTILKEKLNL